MVGTGVKIIIVSIYIVSHITIIYILYAIHYFALDRPQYVFYKTKSIPLIIICRPRLIVAVKCASQLQG